MSSTNRDERVNESSNESATQRGALSDPCDEWPGEVAVAVGSQAASWTPHVTNVIDVLLSWGRTIASAAVYALLIVSFVFQVARVEGRSMEPTLANQDRLIVNKFAYRIADPQVGDIVMLYYPFEPEKTFVKRIVAGPDDVIRSVQGKLYRNDVPLPDDYIPLEFRSFDTWGPETVAAGHYFVMGDHRNNSSDSRTWGVVPKKYIAGRIQLRWWPVRHAALF